MLNKKPIKSSMDIIETALHIIELREKLELRLIKENLQKIEREDNECRQAIKIK